MAAGRQLLRKAFAIESQEKFFWLQHCLDLDSWPLKHMSIPHHSSPDLEVSMLQAMASVPCLLRASQPPPDHRVAKASLECINANLHHICSSDTVPTCANLSEALPVSQECFPDCCFHSQCRPSIFAPPHGRYWKLRNRAMLLGCSCPVPP